MGFTKYFSPRRLRGEIAKSMTTKRIAAASQKNGPQGRHRFSANKKVEPQTLLKMTSVIFGDTLFFRI